MTQLVPLERIERIIYLVRGQKVMIDRDLAELYEVETGALNRAVKRNLGRFPEDFMFQLTAKEAQNLRCQIGISSSAWGGNRRQGAKRGGSERAIQDSPRQHPGQANAPWHRGDKKPLQAWKAAT